MTAQESITALARYVDWYRARKASDPNFDIDWIGKTLIHDEFLFEEMNKTQIMPAMHAGNMSYTEREDVQQHQFADMWIQRWRMHNIYKKYRLTLMDWFSLPYPDVEWLLLRARKEDEAVAKKQQEAERNAPSKPDVNETNAAELAYALRQGIRDGTFMEELEDEE